MDPAAGSEAGWTPGRPQDCVLRAYIEEGASKSRVQTDLG